MSHCRIAFVVLLVSLCPVLAHAADLTLDGQEHLAKLQGLPLSLTITGEPGAEIYLFVDVSPGPVLLFGNPVELGFTPAVLLLALGPMPGSGELTLNGSVPLDQGATGKTVYMLALVASDPSPPLWEVSNGASLTMLDRNVQLAADPLASYPFVEHPKAFNAGSTISVAVDTALYPWAVGSADVYVVAHKSRAQWLADGTLIDVTAFGPETETITAGGVQANTFVPDIGSLSGAAAPGVALGQPYDVVVDLDQDGVFDDEDLIDGFDATEAGFYVVHDVQLPGPHAVTEILYTGGSFLGQDLYYPTNIASMGQLPVMIIGHGNGHNYQWYDHIGFQMASYGWIVMSHENNTGPGIEAASTTTLTNTDFLLGNLGTIGGGVLSGHVDTGKIVWVGHSRGGEGITRAFDRIFDGQFVPVNYGVNNIQLMSSIAPTDFLGPGSSNPHDKPYHLWVGAADADVTGCANNDVAQSFHLLARATGPRWSISLHGVGHGDFHASTGSVASGPCLVGKPTTHTIMRGYLVPLAEHVVRGNIPAADFLYRQWESFAPIGAPVANPCVHVDLTDHRGPTNVAIIDDFQTNAALNLSSSGGAVSGTATLVAEGVLNDPDLDFTWDGENFSGFTWCRPTDVERGLVLEYDNVDRDLVFSLTPQLQDMTDYRWLSFRACQVTRHPFTTAVLGDTTFAVTLTDLDSVAVTVNIGAFGGGAEEPYQKTGCGIGAGWGNEFETIRIPLESFATDASGIDLSRIASVTFRFGPSFGSPQGRLGLDGLELVED